jgi:hypothetical protein
MTKYYPTGTLLKLNTGEPVWKLNSFERTNVGHDPPLQLHRSHRNEYVAIVLARVVSQYQILFDCGVGWIFHDSEMMRKIK